MKDVGIDCHPAQSEEQMASTLQAILMACKGPVFPQDCTGRGYEGVEEETELCGPSTPFICPYHVGSAVLLQFPVLTTYILGDFES